MHALIDRKHRSIQTFLIPAVLINGTASILSRHHFNGDIHHLVPYALVFDMTVVVPTLYYLLVVRRGTRTVTSFVLLVLVCIMRAFLVVPTVMHGAYVLLGMEGGILGLVCLRVHQAMRIAASHPGTGDPLQLIETACASVVPVDKAARFLSSELAVFYYALFSWSSGGFRRDGQTFTTHTTSGFAIYCLFWPALCQ